MPRRSTWTAVFCALGAVALAGAGQTLTKHDADSLEKKINAVLERGALTAPPAKPLRTVVTDREVNAYFQFQGAEKLPAGVVNPRITLAETGRMTAAVTVDLDAVRKSKERGWSDPLAYVSGSVEVRAAGLLHGANGQGTVVLESATLGGVPLPKAFLQEIISYYSKTPESPSGFSLDQPFALPQKIRQVDFQRGAAVIVQ
jgi:hypothetical protein